MFGSSGWIPAFAIARFYLRLLGPEAENFAIDNPAVAAGLLGLALGAAIAVVGYIYVRYGSQIKILYRAWRKYAWVKFGSTAHSPMEKRYRAYLERRYGKRIKISAEGAAFRCSGYLFLTDEEIGFVTLRLGVMTEMSLPLQQVLEAHISKRGIYDVISISSKNEDIDIFKVYRGIRDIGQEFFNALQMGLGAIRFNVDRRAIKKPQ